MTTTTCPSSIEQFCRVDCGIVRCLLVVLDTQRCWLASSRLACRPCDACAIRIMPAAMHHLRDGPPGWCAGARRSSPARPAVDGRNRAKGSGVADEASWIVSIGE
eukprot:1783973-Prymnesium_polylepis.1